MVKFTISGKRGKNHKGVEHKTKRKSYGRNGERKQSNKVTWKEWEVRKKTKSNGWNAKCM
jgi:hypothetical protein